MKARQFPASVYSGLKATLRAMVSESFGGQKVAAAATRVEQGMISDYCSTTDEHAEKHVPADVLLDLVAASGDTRVLRYLAEQANCLLVPLPTGMGGEIGDRMGKSAQEFGDVLVRVSAAMADGVMTGPEADGALREILETMVQLGALAEAVKAARDKSEGK